MNEQEQKTPASVKSTPEPAPVVLKKDKNKKSNKGLMIALIISGVSIALISIIIVLVLIFMPNDSKTLSNAIDKLGDAKSATISSKADDYKVQGNPEFKVDLEKEMIEGSIKYKDITISYDTFDIEIYGKKEDTYVSGKTFADVTNASMAKSLTSQPSMSGFKSQISSLKYDFEDGYVKMNTEKSSFKDFTAEELSTSVKDVFTELDSKNEEIEIISKEKSGDVTTFKVEVEGDEVEIVLNSKNEITSIKRGESSSYDYIEIKNINSTDIEEVSESKLYSESEVTDEFYNKFIDKFADYAVSSGMITSSQKEQFKTLMRQQVKKSSNSSFSI